jgi:hypothetical protein
MTPHDVYRAPGCPAKGCRVSPAGHFGRLSLPGRYPAVEKILDKALPKYNVDRVG